MMDVFKVFDSALGGLNAYKFVPESRQCVRFLIENHDNLNYTLFAWNFTNDASPKIYNTEPFDITAYNAT